MRGFSFAYMGMKADRKTMVKWAEKHNTNKFTILQLETSKDRDYLKCQHNNVDQFDDIWMICLDCRYMIKMDNVRL